MFSVSLNAQNVGINADGSAPESGTMLDIKIGTAKATTGGPFNILQLKTNDADADAFKFRIGLRTNSAAGSRYGFLEVPDFASSTPTYRNFSLLPNGGFVGIGTSSPSQKLDVAGNIKFSGALMSNDQPGSSG